jgi:hypothetical protein
MTKEKQSRVCDTCRYDGGWHYDDEGNATRCPNYLAADAAATAQKLSAEANERAKEAAHRIIADAAETLPEFSANQVRQAMEDAQIPSAVIGNAFNWAHKQGLIVPTGRRVMSTEDTTRHRIDVWASTKFKGTAA